MQLTAPVHVPDVHCVDVADAVQVTLRPELEQESATVAPFIVPSQWVPVSQSTLNWHEPGGTPTLQVPSPQLPVPTQLPGATLQLPPLPAAPPPPAMTL